MLEGTAPVNSRDIFFYFVFFFFLMLQQGMWAQLAPTIPVEWEQSVCPKGTLSGDHWVRPTLCPGEVPGGAGLELIKYNLRLRVCPQAEGQQTP